jgi:hypothetical protein
MRQLGNTAYINKDIPPVEPEYKFDGRRTRLRFQAG